MTNARRTTVVDKSKMCIRYRYPDAQFLKMAAEMNIPLTISSDAHKPEDVGRDFEMCIRDSSRRGGMFFFNLSSTNMNTPAMASP